MPWGDECYTPPGRRPKKGVPFSVEQNRDAPKVPEGICTPRREKIPDKKRAIGESYEETDTQAGEELAKTSPQFGDKYCKEQSNTGSDLTETSGDSIGPPAGIQASIGVPWADQQTDAIKVETGQSDVESIQNSFSDPTVDAEGTSFENQVDPAAESDAGLQENAENPIA